MKVAERKKRAELFLGEVDKSKDRLIHDAAMMLKSHPDYGYGEVDLDAKLADPRMDAARAPSRRRPLRNWFRRYDQLFFDDHPEDWKEPDKDLPPGGE